MKSFSAVEFGKINRLLGGTYHLLTPAYSWFLLGLFSDREDGTSVEF
jgi:hypothetical protein